MNDDLRAQDREALDALRASSRRPSDVARARSRRAFVEGRPESTRRPWIHALAAVAALVLLWIGSTPTEAWTLRMIDGPSVATRGSVPADLTLGEEFLAGPITTGPDTELELERGNLLLRIRPDTDARIPAAPGRWIGRSRTIEVTQGEVFGSTGDDELGFELVLQTDQASARLTGTTFAVFRTDDATCFCLFRGGLEVTPHGGDTIELPVGKRVFVYGDGRPPRVEALDAHETMKLQMIDDAAVQR